MLKKLTLLAILFFSTSHLFASHVTGGELRYEFNGTGYTIYASVEFDCATFAVPANQVINITSSCSSPMSLTVPLTSVDTISQQWCPYSTASCGGSLNLLVRANYVTTIALTPCADWVISFSETALSSMIDNIQFAAMEDMYMVATLDNSNAENNCPLPSANPPYILGNNTLNTFPYQIMDADGDSIVFAFKHAETSGGTQMNYSTGFSATTQMGFVTTINNSNQTMNLFTLTQSENYLYTIIRNYRNGVLVGTHTKSWTTFVRPTSNPIIPAALPGQQFTYSMCPGQTSTFTLNFMDSVTTDTVFIDFNPPVMTGVTYSTTTTTTPGTGTGTITVTLPGTFNVNATPYFYIPVTVSDHRCPNQGITTYNILVNVIQCNSDSVWAGDANADFTADMYDPLAIAVAYGTTGTVRPGATTTWQAEYCPNWATQFNTGVNHKHADCNGDGTIDNSDLAAITANYGQVHMKGGANAKSTSQAELYFDLTGISFTAGATVTVPIKLGNSSFNMNNMYGLATQIDLQGVTFAGAPTFNYTTSWVGTTSNTLNFLHNANNNNMDWVLARTDQQNVSGQGTIATMTFTIPATTPNNTPLIFHFAGTRIVDNNGDDLTAFGVVDDTAYIYTTSVATTEPGNTEVLIVPNPSKTTAQLQVTATANEVMTIIVTDVTGRLISKQNVSVNKGIQNITLPSVAPGMYEVQVQSNSQPAKAMKWVQL